VAIKKGMTLECSIEILHEKASWLALKERSHMPKALDMAMYAYMHL
jgi:hypothetical protein